MTYIIIMACAENGYDYDFVDDIPEELVCVICHLPLKDPVQIADCGHRLCKVCFNQHKDHCSKR